MEVQVTIPREAGNFFREIRISKKMKQEELANLAGCSTMTLQNIEHGRPSFNFSTFMAISNALGVEVKLSLKGESSEQQ